MTKNSNSINKIEQIVDKYQTNNFTAYINYSILSNQAIFKIFYDFFNILYQDKQKQKKYKIKVYGLLNENMTFLDTIYDDGSPDQYIIVEMCGLFLTIRFNRYKTNNEWYYFIMLSSEQKTIIKTDYIYLQLFASALNESELKGSYITMAMNVFQWEIKQIEKRNMSDIYFPLQQKNDLQLYIDTFNTNYDLLRYLFVGVPGTGKTESCLALMNELNKQGITIIKTPIDDYFNEKVQLAIILKPSIIVLDDLDLSLGSRNSGNYSVLLQQFLDVLDGTEKLPSDVGILATTNSAYLLYIAAQRPGRFNKIILFDELTKDNIRDIIKKSLKFKFNLTLNEDIKDFIHDDIINAFYDNNVSGAHIYNHISMIKLKYDILQKKDDYKLSTKWILDEINSEINVLKKIKKQQEINDKLSNNNCGTIGFNQNKENEAEKRSDLLIN